MEIEGQSKEYDEGDEIVMAKKRKKAGNYEQPQTIHCENCGEDYSTTYKSCPFCNEGPGRGLYGRRADGTPARNPFQLVGLVASLILIIVALFIIFTKISPLLMNNGEPVDPDNPGTQPGYSENVENPTPGNTIDPPEDPSGLIQAVSLSRSELELKVGETYQLTVLVSPEGTGEPVIWSSSHPNVLSVDQEGNLRNSNNTGGTVSVTITAACGGLSAECVVDCGSSAVGGNSGSSTSTQRPPSGSSGTTTSKQDAVVVNAGNGLNIRSGPGSNYDKIASAANGAHVEILEDMGNGWYRIDYGNGKEGYASSQFIRAK